MTIDNKEWIVNQTLRLSLSGLSQEQIAGELQVSEGTINAIMQELINCNENFRIQHEIAIVSKKSGVSIKQLASNMAFANSIKLMAFKGNQTHSVLGAIDSFCVQEGSYDPNVIATLFIQFCDLVMKNRISPGNLIKQLKSKYEEYHKLIQQVEREKVNLSQIQEKSRSELERYNVTTEILQDFLTLKEHFEDAGLDFDKREEIRNVLYNISMMDKDAEMVINEIKRIRLLKLHKVELLGECEKTEKTLAFFKREEEKVKSINILYAQAMEIINKLLQKGTSPENILKLFDIYSKHYPHLSLDKFASDIDIYGGIQGAIYKTLLDYTRTNLAAQDPTSTLHRVNTNNNASYWANINQFQHHNKLST